MLFLTEKINECDEKKEFLWGNDAIVNRVQK